MSLFHNSAHIYSHVIDNIGVDACEQPCNNMWKMIIYVIFTQIVSTYAIVHIYLILYIFDVFKQFV